ncbi:MAG: hypothetical protein U0271_37130 [Polyangiaceae bacterium]
MTTTHIVCNVCGGSQVGVSTGELTCRYCRATVSTTTPNTASITVNEAANRWARSVFGAPRRLADLIDTIEPRDEMIERVITEVTRRDIFRERIAAAPNVGPASRKREPDAATIDPFSITVSELRDETEQVVRCDGCSGSGLANCHVCGSSGRARCHFCAGSGTMPSTKTNRMIKCSVCRGSGATVCGACNGSGRLACGGCAGSGKQLSWLTYTQRAEWRVTVAPQSAVVGAHACLTEKRPLTAGDVRELGLVTMLEANGPVSEEHYREAPVEPEVLLAVAREIDPRLERITRQQYVKLAMIRRDVQYEIAGRRAALVLSGRDLKGAHDPGTEAPIRRRVRVWAVGWALASVVLGLLVLELRGRAAYFANTNALMMWAWLGGVLSLAVLFGGLSREWRAGLRFGRLTIGERGAGVLTALAPVVMVIGYAAGRPSLREVESALGKNDVAQARRVVDALKEASGSRPDVLDAEDSVLIAEAANLHGDARLKVLDDVARRNGTYASAAAASAKLERLTSVRALIDAKRAEAALSAIDAAWPGAAAADPEVAAERARASDLQANQCSNAACRVQAANLANVAASTPARADAAAKARSALVRELSVEPIKGESLLERLVRMRAVRDLADDTVRIVNDKDLTEKARSARTAALKERAKVPILGSDKAIAIELLGGTADTDNGFSRVTVDTTSVYLVLDGANHCTGLYVVGSKRGARTVGGGAEWSSARILSQAIGNEQSILPPDRSDIATWTVGGTPVVARYDSGSLVEIRIGDAKPF